MPAQSVIRIVSYNIHKGLTFANRNFILPTLREALAKLQPDIVFLQEVLGQHDKHAGRFEKWPVVSQCEYLAEGLWPHYAYGKNAVYMHGHHGNAILSKFPIIEWSNTNISTNSWESRGVLHVVFAVPGILTPVHGVCVHLNMGHRGRKTQLGEVCRKILRKVPESEPLILAGDFNDWAQSASKLLFGLIGANEVFLDLTGSHAQSFPSRLPLLKLDRVYARGLEPLCAEVLIGAPWSVMSDHLPLYAELRLSIKETTDDDVI